MSTVQNFGKGVMRVAKNYTKGYSDVQSKVREATSNDPWGPSGTQMNELAQLSYNQYVELYRIWLASSPVCGVSNLLHTFWRSICVSTRADHFTCPILGTTSSRSWKCLTNA